ncbi:hypothetical protein OOK36_56795 [Streptomyces sp. NBC_00365]|uniref:hypothetical protein n=1 Tax=unclassified Streptomyces TaxID=2593676 RepID=UPI002257A285|nr:MULTISPECIES: hypothetical protein [unclassified Streptomyces]MCX5097896.1 hypothetical protein [Streptomyces sp. NBC_00365]
MDGARSPGHLAELGELLLRARKADLEPFDLTGPSFAFRCGDPGGQVVTDLEGAGPLGR